MKLYLMIFFVFLDVAIFPFSCAPRKHYEAPEHKVIFETSSTIKDEENNFVANVGYTYHYSLPDTEIELPEEIILEEQGYHISYWYLDMETKEEISFPYCYKDEDFSSYYNGFRNCIVIYAHWEKDAVND